MAPRTVEIAELADLLIARSNDSRLVAAVAGAPGSGKSTLAEKLVAEIETRRPGMAAILPMDGYHYDDVLLDRMGRRARKGAPDTFDVGGYRHMLQRLRADNEAAVAVPVFDRDIEIARRRLPPDPARGQDNRHRGQLSAAARSPLVRTPAPFRRHRLHRCPRGRAARASLRALAGIRHECGGDPRQARGKRPAERTSRHRGKHRAGFPRRGVTLRPVALNMAGNCCLGRARSAQMIVAARAEG